MNSVSLIGNLALDPELKKTKSGKDVCTVRVGVSRAFRNENGVRESDFINVQCWEQSARFVSKFLKKGDRIGINGELRERSYEGQDGQKHYVIEVLATHVESLNSRRDGGAEDQSSGKQAGAFTEIDDDDLPF